MTIGNSSNIGSNFKLPVDRISVVVNVTMQSLPSSLSSCRYEGPDEPVPVLSVPGRRDVRPLLLSAQLHLPSPALQTGPRDVVEVVSTKVHYESGY